MSTSSTIAKNPPTVPPTYAALPALLSYLVPGLGQIYQGRVAKGILFLVCVYGLFFYGMALGNWKNVYIPDVAQTTNPLGTWPTVANLYNRPQFLGQFWVGIAAWPAILQYNAREPVFPFGRFERSLSDADVNVLENNEGKVRDLGWVYTVIAGVLNIMVIYDALAGPAYLVGPNLPTSGPSSKETRAQHASSARR